MNELLQQVMGSIDSSVVQQVASRLGIPPDQAQGVIGAAMPSILGAIGQRASTPDGADAIHAAAQQQAGMDVSQVVGMIGGASGSGMQGVLGQIFGGQNSNAAQGVGAATGLPPEHASHILSILGPVVMAAIGNHAAQSGANAQGLGQILGDAAQQVQSGGGLDRISGMLGSLFGKH